MYICLNTTVLVNINKAMYIVSATTGELSWIVPLFVSMGLQCIYIHMCKYVCWSLAENPTLFKKDFSLVLDVLHTQKACNKLRFFGFLTGHGTALSTMCCLYVEMHPTRVRNFTVSVSHHLDVDTRGDCHAYTWMWWQEIASQSKQKVYQFLLRF